MVPTADRQKATVLVRIGFDALDPRLLPDMGVKVTFLKPTAPAAGQAAAPAAPTLWVPSRAVRRDGTSQAYVFITTAGRAARRAVQVGRTSGADVEIRSGIAAGDRVIVGGPEALADGIAIEEIRP